MGREKIIKNESTFPHSFLLLVSLAIKYVTVYAVKRRQCLAVCTVPLSILWDVYCRHKNHLLSMVTESTKAKNDVGTDRRTPLASASCFTAQLTSMAQRVAVAMNHGFSATASNAQGLCQTHSVSRCGCSIPPPQWPERKDTVLLQSTITLLTQQMDMEIGTRLWT